jgi:hypothetical protein
MTELGVGAAVDIGDAQLSALVEIKASLDGMTSSLKKLLAAEYAYEQHGPTFHPLRNGGVSPATGNFAFGLDGPAYGRRWEIRNLVIGGLYFSSTVSGTALALRTSVASVGLLLSQINLADVVDQASTLPDVAFYSSGQFVLRAPEKLVIVIIGPTASTPYVAGGSYIDVPDQPLRGVVGE